MEPRISWEEAERRFPRCSVVWDIGGRSWTPELRLDLVVNDAHGYVLKAGDPNCGYEQSCACCWWDPVDEKWVSDWEVMRMRLKKK